MPETPGADAPDSTPDEPLSAACADPYSFLSGQAISPVPPVHLPTRRRTSTLETPPKPVSPKARKTTHALPAKTEAPVGRLITENFLVNLAGDYRYLKSGYYASQDYEAAGTPIHPTCAEIMDAYVVPLFLEKAQRAGIPIPAYYISNGYFEPPVIVDTINPFMTRHSVVLKKAAQERISKSLTRNFTYAICCQDLPPDARVVSFNLILGWTAQDRFKELALSLWHVFRLPVAKVRAIVTTEGDILASGLQPLLYARLSDRERAWISREVVWHK